MEYTAEELALLSDEERAAIAGDPVDVDALRVIAEGGEDAGDDGATGDGDATKIVEAAEQNDSDAAPDDGTPVDAAPQEAFMHQYHADPVENFDAKMVEFTEQKADLRAKFKNGDLDIDEYELAKDAVVAQEMTLRDQKTKADISAEQKDQEGKARWNWEQDRFFRDSANAIYQDKYLLAAFDAAVRDLGGDPKCANWEGHQFLQEADKIIRSRFNAPKAEAPAVPAAKPESRKPDLRAVPKTLSNLPAAEIAQTGEVDEFAHIDRLTGVAYEHAVARLSDAERERFRMSA